MSIIFRSPHEVAAWRKTAQPKSVGFVATMGALHPGHASLLQQSRKENSVTVLSIFVNPTQFNDKKDFEKYPLSLEKDLSLAKENGVDVVFAPTAEMIYPDKYKYKVIENELSQILCGKDRPGHFDGVLTIVMRLLQIVQPSKAYFGEKDFQQLSLIKNMVTAFFLPVEIIPVATLREDDGLAMSSRNIRLSIEDRKKAPLIYKSITQCKSAPDAIVQLQSAGFIVDYVIDLQGRRFAAAKLGEVRLIDNVKI